MLKLNMVALITRSKIMTDINLKTTDGTCLTCLYVQRARGKAHFGAFFMLRRERRTFHGPVRACLLVCREFSRRKATCMTGVITDEIWESIAVVNRTVISTATVIQTVVTPIIS